MLKYLKVQSGNVKHPCPVEGDLSGKPKSFPSFFHPMSNPSCFLSLLMFLRRADKEGKGVKVCELHFQFTALRS